MASTSRTPLCLFCQEFVKHIGRALDLLPLTCGHWPQHELTDVVLFPTDRPTDTDADADEILAQPLKEPCTPQTRLHRLDAVVSFCAAVPIFDFYLSQGQLQLVMQDDQGAVAKAVD